MNRVIEWLGDTLGVDAALVAKLLLTIGIAVALWLLRSVWMAIVNRRTDDPQSRYRWRKAAWYTVAVVGILLIGRVWLEGVQTLATYLGLVSAGVAIALRDPIVNWFGWIFIGWGRPYSKQNLHPLVRVVEGRQPVEVGFHRGSDSDWLEFFQPPLEWSLGTPR